MSLIGRSGIPDNLRERFTTKKRRTRKVQVSHGASELAWRDDGALFPHNRAQVDSMAVDVIWHAVNLGKALEGVPECRPSFE
jgi:hypothetical protein